MPIRPSQHLFLRPTLRRLTATRLELARSCQRDRMISHSAPGTQNITPSANDSVRGDQPAPSSSKPVQ